MNTEASPASAPDGASRLISYLQRYKEDRGALAKLRCGLHLGRPKESRAWELLGQYDGIRWEGYEDREHRANVVLTVAGLWACNPAGREKGNFGTTCRNLASVEERRELGKSGQTGPMAKHFQRLIAAQSHEICERVIRVGIRAAAKPVAINPFSLYRDLLFWNKSKQESWARAFWGGVDEEAQ